MKKLLFLLLPVLLCFGCVSMKNPVMLNKSYPSAEKYEILGQVGIRKNQYIILGLIWLGGADWVDLRNEAVRIYGKKRVDDVVSVSLDDEIGGVPFLVIREMVMTGTAIRYITPEPVSTPVEP